MPARMPDFNWTRYSEAKSPTTEKKTQETSEKDIKLARSRFKELMRNQL